MKPFESNKRAPQDKLMNDFSMMRTTEALF